MNPQTLQISNHAIHLGLAHKHLRRLVDLLVGIGQAQYAQYPHTLLDAFAVDRGAFKPRDRIEVFGIFEDYLFEDSALRRMPGLEKVRKKPWVFNEIRTPSLVSIRRSKFLI